MTTSILFSPIPKNHVLIQYNYRIPPYNGVDAFDKTLDYVKINNPELIPKGASHGKMIALILPIFNIHDDRLSQCIPLLSIDDFKDAAAFLAESDCQTFLTLIRYCSKGQFDALSSMPQICSHLRKASFEDVEPYLNHIDSILKVWISHSSAFSPIALNDLFLLVLDGDVSAKNIIKDIPPLTLVLNNFNPETMGILSEFMVPDQIAFIAKNATYRVAIAVKRRLESIDSPLIDPFFQALEYNSNFIHLHPRYTFNEVLSQLKNEAQETAEKIEKLSRTLIRTYDESQFLERALAFHGSRYYKSATSLARSRLGKDECKLFERLNALISKIKPHKAHESPVIPALVALLKIDISYFISRLSDKKEFIEVCKYLKDTDPFFAKTLAQICLVLIDCQASLVVQVADACLPYERNLLLSNLTKTASREQKLKLAAILHKYIERFLELWETIEGAFNDDDLISILKYCYDTIGSEFAINLRRIPAMNRAILNRLPELNITLISAFIAQVDEDTQMMILTTCQDNYDKIAYLLKVSSNAQKKYFNSIHLEEFRKLLPAMRTNYSSPVLLCVLKNGSEEQLKELGSLSDYYRDYRLEDQISFMDGLSHERKNQIGDMVYRGKKARDFVRLSETYTVSSIPPFLFLFTELEDDYFKGVRAEYFSDKQVAMIAKFGKRSQVLALEEGLKQKDHDYHAAQKFSAFYRSLPLVSNNKEQLSLSECAEVFTSKLKPLLEKGRFALKEFKSGNYDYEKVIKPLRRCFNASKSSSSFALSKIIKEKLPKESNNLYQDFMDFCNSIMHLTWSGKDGFRHRIDNT